MPTNPPSPAPGGRWRPRIDESERRTEADPRWRQRSTGEAARRRAGRRQVFLGVALGAFAVCTMLLVWVALWLWPQKPAGLVLIGASYAENLNVPPNVHGWEGLQALAAATRDNQPAALWGWSSGRIVLKHEPRELRVGDVWDRDLAKFREKTLVIVLALHGGVDRQGPYLLPQDANGGDEPRQRLRVTQILDDLAKLPAEQHKLLVLDATRVGTDWRLGLLYNDFAHALAGLEGRIAAVPNLVVLSASDVKQRSWESDDWQQSIFLHYVLEGIRGGAELTGNGRITAWELYQYVRRSVQPWAETNREALQTPVLLPAGEAGERRARGMPVTSVPGDYEPANPAETPEFARVPPELERSWIRFRELATAIPSPAAYTPHLWQQYQAAQLRYEALVLARSGAATKLASRLADLESEIVRARTLELGSAQNTLTMAAVAGYAPLPTRIAPLHPEKGTPLADKPLAEYLDDLWNTPAEEFRKKWDDLLKLRWVDPAEVASRFPGVDWNAPLPENLKALATMVHSFQEDATARRLLRLDLNDLLLDHTAQRPAAFLRKIALVLRELDDPLSPRPAELHFLTMLNRDLPEDLLQADRGDLVRLALTVRRLAERAAMEQTANGYPYNEVVRPWVAAAMAEADKLRRFGEDHLLAADDANAAKARTFLSQAQDAYAKIAADAALVRQACQVRDQALSTLPDFSRWVGRKVPAKDPREAADDNQFLDQMETTWLWAHQLARALEAEAPEVATLRQAPAPTPAEAQPHSLAELTELVRTGLKAVEARYVKAWERDDVDLVSLFRQAEDALAVPYPDLGLRLRLLRNVRRVSRKFLLETGQAGRETAGTLNPDQLQAQVLDVARRSGRMALAVLGRRWFEEGLPGEGETFTQVRHRLETSPVDPQWWDALVRAGDQIGRRWRYQAPFINERLAAAAKATDLKAARADLRAADRVGRQIDGAGSLYLAADPCQPERRLLVQDFLLWQVQRTWEDHWYAGDPAALPYYRTAGQVLVDDARRLAPLALTQPAVDAAEKLLKTDGNLVFTDPYRRDGLSRKILTSEQDFTIKAQLEPAPEAKVPTGFPLVWLERDPRDFRPPVMLQTVTPPEGTRQVVQIGAEPALGQLTARLNSPYLRQAEEQPPKVPRIDQTGLRLRGLYRGQQIDRLVPVDLIPVPLVTYAEPPITLTAGVAVRGPKGYGEGNGAVTVILDCSGSMGPPEGQRPTPETKFVQATAALREILTRLPGGTMVNVWVYGQAMGREKTVKDVERTVKPLFPQPVAWNPDDASQLEGLMAKVAALEPWNETPAVHAILKAREEMLALNPPGYKTILVLTDGMDNRFGKPDPMTPRNQQIRKALREAFTMKEGISLNIVGFRISPDGQETDEERNAREQFEVVENLSPPGRFWSVKTQDQLIAALDQALRQKLRARLDSEDNIPDRRLQEGVDVTPLGSNPNWRLGVPPGGYRLWATFGPQRPERRLALSPGDLMLVNLVPGQGRGLEFERALYGLEPVNQTKPAKANDRGDWRLTVLQNQAPSGGPGLQALLALEKTYDRSETSLEQLKPRRLWLELATPQDVRTPFVQRWSFRPGYPAPAWGIDVPAWPVQAATQAPAAPVLRAWWNPDLEPAPAATLERGADFRSTVDLVSRPIPIGPATAYLESVTAETRNVETAPGTWAMQPCLVVRLTYPKDQPLLVRPGNLAVQGREHRLYRDVNKVTALFWPVAAADVDNKLAALQFYDLAAFQAEAKARGYWLELGNLRPPDAGDNPPPRLPVPELSSRPERRGGP